MRATQPADDIVPILQQGTQFQAQGDFGRAAACYRNALDRQPNQPDALHLLGTVALAVGDADTAIDLFRRALAPKSSDPALRINLANALLQRRDTKNAEFHLRKALKLNPDNPSALSFLANCKSITGDEQAAKQIYEDLLARFPDHPQATFGYAHLCVTLGELETARTLYRRALGRGTARTLALIGLSSCEKIAPDSPEAAEIERCLKQPGLQAVEYVGLRYAAGRIAEEAGRFDDAFRYFSEAKAFAGVKFDIEARRRVYATIKSLFTPSFFASRSGHGDPSACPVFVVGMPRSGTTLTEQIISSHPDAAGAGERGDITLIAGSLGFRPNDAQAFAKRVMALTPKETRKLANDYLTVLNRISGTASRVTDKMPDNFQYLGLIALMFPNAKIVHCQRDPLDTCISCFTTQLEERNHLYATDFATLGAYYREYAGLMDHWRSALPLPIFDSSYEALIESPEERSRALIDFVGLPWDPACLSFHETERPIQTISRVQVRQPLYASSVGRWRGYAEHLEPLRAALGDLVPPG